MPMKCIRDFSFVRGLRSRACLSVRSSVKWLVVAGTALGASLVLTPLAANAQGAPGPVAEVNPMIGTGTGPGDSENLFPGPSMPFGMVQLSPDTESSGYGYHYYEHKILGFSMTHMSGVGCPNDGEVFFTPTTGPIEIEDDASAYSHQQEHAEPGYYRVQLLRWGIQAALTATVHTGEVQLIFPAGKQANLLIPISHTLNHAIGAQVQIAGNDRVPGYVMNETFCGSNRPYKVYFVMQFSHPFATYGTWSGYRDGSTPAIAAGTREATQTADDKQVGAYVSWPQSAQSRTITVQIGISYVDLRGAENNLETEAAHKSFSQIRGEAAAAWNKALSV